MQFIILVSVFVTVAKSNVIPSNPIHDNSTGHTLIKRENYENVWINNKEPLLVCPTIQASLAPVVQNRFCEENYEDDLGDYFVTIGDVQSQTPWLKERAAHNEKVIRSRHSVSPDEKNRDDNIFLPFNKDALWTYDLNTKNIADVLQEPSEEDLKVFFSIDDLPNTNVPVIVAENSKPESPVVIQGALASSDTESNLLKKQNTMVIQNTNITSGPQQDLVKNENVLQNPTPSPTNQNSIPSLSKNEEPVICNPAPIEESQLTDETQHVKNEDVSKSEKLNIQNDEPVSSKPVNEEEVMNGMTTTEHISQPDKQVKSKEDHTKATIDDLKETNDLMNEMLEKLKYVENFENIEKSIKDLIESINGDISLESKIGKEPKKRQVSDTLSSVFL